MLKQRILTAIVLLALLLPALFATSPWPFVLFTLLAVAAAGWEWGRLNGGGFGAALALGALVAAACLLALQQGWAAVAPSPWWLAATLAWLIAATVLLPRGPDGWPRIAKALRWLIGFSALVAAWLAMAQARSIGLNFLLSVFCLVWMADIAAYFSGRAFGRRKLAPRISPGKSWEGVAGGMLGVLLLAVLWLMVERSRGAAQPSLYALLVDGLGWPLAALALAALAGISVVGDLFESLVKRAVGAKDSSALLPGHGGVLDRIDALLPTFPVALSLVALATR